MAIRTRRSSSKLCTVVGGCGFLGQHIVEKLLDRGYHVNVFDIRQTFESDRVHFFVGDICNKEELLPALIGASVVFHCATPPPLSNNRQLFLKVNVEGTKVMINACKEAGVERLVLTSTAGVVYDGTDIEDGNEDLPYASRPMNYYLESKIQQEQLVLAANGDKLATVAIRPHGIFGPKDTLCIPTIAKAGREGKTKFIIGNGKNIADFTYVENVAHGHVMAGEALHKDSKLCGKAYNITNDAPVPFWDFMSRILTGLGYPAPKFRLPYSLMFFLASVLQLVCWILRPLVTIEPFFSPTRMSWAGTHHYFSCQRAKRDFGYKPVVSFDEGVRRSLEHYSYLHKDRQGS